MKKTFEKLIILTIAASTMIAGCGFNNGAKTGAVTGESQAESEVLEEVSEPFITPVMDAVGWTKPVPDSYRLPAAHQGRVEPFSYTSRDYAGEGEEITKPAFIYLPYGYDESGEDACYDILYFMHGWQGTAAEYVQMQDGALVNVLDHMIEEGEVKPLIIVLATFDAENLPQELERSMEEVRQFHLDFRQDLVPAVESRYKTYAKSTSPEDLRASRRHRGFGGFSLGSVTTWEQFIYNNDYITWFMPLDAGCWYFGDYGDYYPEKNVDFLEKIALESNLAEEGFFIYATTGTEDVFYDHVEEQMNLMLSRGVFGDGNVVYYKKEGGRHDHEAGLEYFYNGLPCFFGQE